MDNVKIEVSLAEWLQKAATYSPQAQMGLERYKKLNLGSLRKPIEALRIIKLISGAIFALFILYYSTIKNIDPSVYTLSSIKENPDSIFAFIFIILIVVSVAFLPIYKYIKNKKRSPETQSNQGENKDLPFNPGMETISYKFSAEGISVSTHTLNKGKKFIIFPWKYITSFTSHPKDYTVACDINYFDINPEVIGPEDSDHKSFLESIYTGQQKYGDVLAAFQMYASKKY